MSIPRHFETAFFRASRRRTSLLVAATLLGASLLGAAFVRPCDAQTADDEAFTAARPAIQHQLRSARAEARLAALRRLEEFPTAGAAKLLVEQGLSSPVPEFRRGAYDILFKFRNSPAVCDYLRECATKSLARNDAETVTAGILAVLLSSELPDVEAAASEMLARTAKAPARYGAFPCALVDELGEQGDAANLTALAKLAKSPLCEQDFGLRRATIQSLARVRRPEAVDALVDLLESAKGETRADILRYLTAISGQRPGEKTEWAEWWRTHRDGFAFPAAATLDVAQDGELFRDLPAYYQIPLLARRIVFVLDTSRSMNGLRILRAKQHLNAAVEALPEDVEFNIVAFNDAVREWQPRQLVAATPKNKHAATQFVYRLPVERSTASYEGLKAAFKYDAEAIYFLTDGAPTSGRIRHPVEIVAAISAENQRRRITIHSIGIGPAGNDFETFLRALASRNYGDYRRVDP